MENRIFAILTEHGIDDCGVWQGFSLSEEDENAIWNILQKYDTQGCSLRGTLKEVIEEIDAKSVSLDFAKSLINDYSQREFEHDADFSDMSDIGLAYTTLTDDEVEIQVSANLSGDVWKQKTWIANQLVEEKEITIDDLQWLDFEELISGWTDYIEDNISEFRERN